MKLRIVAVIFLTLVFAQAIVGQTPVTEPADVRQAAPLPPMPTDRKGLETRGDVMMVRKDYREAVDAYQRALKLEPKSAPLYNKLGIAWHQQTKLDTARKCYQKAIQLNGKFAEAINNLGTVYHAQKKYGSAIRQYQRALLINPDSASFYSNLGTAEFARKRYNEAFQAYGKALQLDPEVFERKSAFGQILQERSAEDKAMFHFYLAKTYAAAGVLDKALDYLRKALEEGFKQTDKIAEDPSFAELIKTDAYIELMKNPPPVIK